MNENLELELSEIAERISRDMPPIIDFITNLSIEISNKKTIIIETLKSIPRSGKSVRLEKFGINLPKRSVYDHIVSLPPQAQFFLSLSKNDLDPIILESMLIFHDLSEAVIGDSPSFTSQDLAMQTFMTEDKKAQEETKINLLLLKILPDHLKPLFSTYMEHHREKKSFLYRYFNMIDKTDPIIAVWRYIFLFRRKIDIEIFLSAMKDFFLNPEPQHICLDNKIRTLIGFLQDPSNARKYHSHHENFFDTYFDASTASILRSLIEDREMHFVEKKFVTLI